MSRTLRQLVPYLLLVSCSTTRAPAGGAPADAGPASERLIYRAALARVPEGAVQCRMAVRWTDTGPTEALRALEAFGLVGNAAFELELEPSSRAALAGSHAQLSWYAHEDGGVAVRELVVETPGEPVELGLRLARPAGVPLETDALEDALVRGTSVTVDGRAQDGVATRLERQVK